MAGPGSADRDGKGVVAHCGADENLAQFKFEPLTACSISSMVCPAGKCGEAFNEGGVCITSEQSISSLSVCPSTVIFRNAALNAAAIAVWSSVSHSHLAHKFMKMELSRYALTKDCHVQAVLASRANCRQSEHHDSAHLWELFTSESD